MNNIYLILSLTLMGIGILCLTVFQSLLSTVTEGGATANSYWVVPIGYFSLLIGAGLLCWAWFRRRKIV